ncbi:hypothetical protein E3J48_03695 [Candidatus Aerophobetes bacterium]|uniref:Uncharacterized protein n=1 Tax=Aerophobetes bacterium TaxID=2030807 RepID=A0A523W744_UNCAE|nr:MAG: hypothetical protein E3J48_03695 [Candidatus Aerophobetes bacterium]
MTKVKINEVKIEFMEEEEAVSLFDDLLQRVERDGVSRKLVEKAEKKILKRTRKAQKTINKGKPSPEQLRSLRESTKLLEDIIKHPNRYSGKVTEEVLKVL